MQKPLTDQMMKSLTDEELISKLIAINDEVRDRWNLGHFESQYEQDTYIRWARLLSNLHEVAKAARFLNGEK